MLSHSLLMQLLYGVAALLCLCSPAVWAATIVDYTVTAVTTAELATLPSDHWAQYVSRCGSAEALVRRIPLIDALRRQFVGVSGSGLRVPFYAWNSTPWHVTGMGFLSPTPYGMCDGLCERDFFATLAGNYGFSDAAAAVQGDRGGDWPMISLYLAAFRAGDADPARSFIVTQERFDWVADGGGGGGAGAARLAGTLVEYCDVPLRGAPAGGAGLTAQVEVRAGGAVVMRYGTLPAGAAGAAAGGTGLVYGRTLRRVVATPTAENGIAAYRFDPVYDVCDGAASASACAALGGSGSSSGGGAGDCVWCPSTSSCASRALVAELCPRGQWALRASDVGAGAQRFYNVSVDFDGFFGVRVSNSLVGVKDILVGGNQFDLMLPVILFNTSTTVKPTCRPGFSCPTQTASYSCKGLQNTCVDGSYNFGLLALESSLGFASTATLSQRLLGERQAHELLCGEADGCPKAMLGVLTGIVFANPYLGSPVFTVQFYVDAAGRIDLAVRCSPCVDGAPLLAYPPIRVGLVRHGVEDASSVLVPQGLLRSGVHVRFVPQTACGDCGLHGSCDEATGTCGCVAGHYGANCLACPVCWAGSRCDDGVRGSGACVCTGGACGAGCGDDGAVAERSCVGCSAVGGRCECGACVCVDGWSGAGCDVPPADACRAYSLDGCAVCGQHAGCEFCFDSTCFNASLRGTSSGYVCSYSTAATDTRACITYAEHGDVLPQATSSEVKEVIAIPIVMLVGVALVTVMLLWQRRLGRVSNAALAVAARTYVDFSDPFKRRSVVVGKFVRRRVTERPLAAMPLKQVSLTHLFMRRTAQREGPHGPNQRSDDDVT